MRLFSRYSGIPNNHVFIIYVYLALGALMALTEFLYIVQSMLDSPLFKADINMLSSGSWSVFLILAIIFSVVLVFIDVLFWFNGYRCKYQMPLHRIVRAFYKKDNKLYTTDATGKPAFLSDSELADRNKAVRNAYLKPLDNGLQLIIPCPKWGSIGIESEVIDGLRDKNGSLNMAQSTVNHNFPNYRFQISHFDASSNRIIWTLFDKD